MTTTPSPSSVTIREKSVNPARHWLGHQTSLDRYNLISGMASRDSRNYSSFLSGSADIPNSLRLFSGPAKARVQKLFQKFREISRLSKNWNGYNADPIPAAVVVKTATFLRKSSQFWPFLTSSPPLQTRFSLNCAASMGMRSKSKSERTIFRSAFMITKALA